MCRMADGEPACFEALLKLFNQVCPIQLGMLISQNLRGFRYSEIALTLPVNNTLYFFDVRLH